MAPNQQTQIQVTHFSKLPQLDGMEVIKGDIPSPGEGEVLCQIFLRPINPTDIHAVQGLRPIGPHHTPHIAGGEGEQATSTHIDTRFAHMFCYALRHLVRDNKRAALWAGDASLTQQLLQRLFETSSYVACRCGQGGESGKRGQKFERRAKGRGSSMDRIVWYLAAISCDASRKPGNCLSACSE